MLPLMPAGWYRALTLAERARLLSSDDETPLSEVDRLRLARWRELSPFRSGESWARRLAADGLDERSFHRLLATPAEVLGARLEAPPGWLIEGAEALSRPAPEDLGPLPVPEEMRSVAAAGFLELIRPLVDRARLRLREGIAQIVRSRGESPLWTAFEAERLVTEPLAFRLLPLLGRTLVLELHVARLQGVLSGATPEERFASFVERLRDPATAAAMLQEYAVLARLVVQELDLWIAASLEFLERLAADGPLLVATFFGGQDPGPLTSLDGGAGDRHRGGRSVRIASFASGARLVYKPRSLAVDTHFQEVLAWLNVMMSGHPPFRTLRVLDRGAYGWMEHVAAAGCASREEVALYHRRLGGLLALLYVLEATDCHFENLIAAGDQPVVVDLEALFHPRVEVREASRPDERLGGQALAESVLRIGLLPFRVGDSDEGLGADLSGVAMVAGRPTPLPVLQWEGIGTDEMRVVRERVPMEGGRNRPSLDGREMEAAEFKDDMAAGFDGVYRLLAHCRDVVLAFLDRFAKDPVRAVLRSTRIYGLLLSESFHPDVLRDALDRDQMFDRLWVGVEDQPVLARVVGIEHRELHAGDIPAFSALPSSLDLWTSQGERIPGFFRETALAAARRRLLGLGERDLRRQLTLLRLSLGTQLLNRDDVTWSRRAPVDPAPPCSPRELRSWLVGHASGLGSWFEAMALRDERHATWIGLDFRNRVWSLAPAPEDLYAGLPGIALFLGYLGAVTGDTGWTGLARAALASLLARLDLDGTADAGPSSIGAFIGWGGPVYAAASLGALWRDSSLLAAAEGMVERIPPRIEQDEDLDVVGGAAGAILGLLALGKVSGSARPLEVAVLCGEHLLARSCPAGPGLGWLTRLATERSQIGFSHGNAGIGLALVELAGASGDARFLDAGLAAFAWEREVFWPELERWLAGGGDQPPPLESTVAMAWCYGAPGVGLSRLRALRHVRDPDARRVLLAEVEDAVQQTIPRGFGQNHCLCHGDLGNLDFLVQVRRALGRADLDEVIDRQTRTVLASIERDGWHCGTRGDVESPALMNGYAGIGYGLLRLAAPGRVPSVLVLEGPERKDK